MPKPKTSETTKYICLLADKETVAAIDVQAKLQKRSRNNYLLWALEQIAKEPPTA